MTFHVMLTSPGIIIIIRHNGFLPTSQYIPKNVTMSHKCNFYALCANGRQQSEKSFRADVRPWEDMVGLFGLLGFTPQQQPGSYIIKAVKWWWNQFPGGGNPSSLPGGTQGQRKPPNYGKLTDVMKLVTHVGLYVIRPLPSPGIELGLLTVDRVPAIAHICYQYGRVMRLGLESLFLWLVTWLGLAKKWLATWLGLAKKWLVTWLGLARKWLVPNASQKLLERPRDLINF